MASSRLSIFAIHVLSDRQPSTLDESKFCPSETNSDWHPISQCFQAALPCWLALSRNSFEGCLHSKTFSSKPYLERPAYRLGRQKSVLLHSTCISGIIELLHPRTPQVFSVRHMKLYLLPRFAEYLKLALPSMSHLANTFTLLTNTDFQRTRRSLSEAIPFI